LASGSPEAPILGYRADFALARVVRPVLDSPSIDFTLVTRTYFLSSTCNALNNVAPEAALIWTSHDALVETLIAHGTPIL
jgi:hypothetical protein